MASTCIQRWELTLSAYNYTFEYIPGKNIGHADAMNRILQVLKPESVTIPSVNVFVINILDSSPVVAEEIEKLTRADPVSFESEKIHYK